MRFVSSYSSRSIHSEQRSRGFLAVGVAFFAVLMLAVFTAGPASAHNALTTTDPEDGATLSEAPGEIILTFDDKVIEVGSLVSVTGPDGDELADGDVVIERNIAIQQLVENLPAGDYEGLWRVTSADGHPIDGEFTFTAETAVSADEPTEDATGEPGEDATEAATPSAEATPADDATSADADADADDSDSDSNGISVGLLIAIVIGAFILGGIVVLLVNKNRNAARKSADENKTDSGSEPGN